MLSFTNKIVVLDQNPGKKESRFEDIILISSGIFRVLSFIYSLYSFSFQDLSVVLHSTSYLGVIRVLPALLLNYKVCIFIHNGRIPRGPLNPFIRYLRQKLIAFLPVFGAL